MADLKIDIVANASNALKGIDAVIDSTNKLRTAVAKAGNKDVGGIVSADTTKAAEAYMKRLQRIIALSGDYNNDIKVAQKLIRTLTSEYQKLATVTNTPVMNDYFRDGIKEINGYIDQLKKAEAEQKKLVAQSMAKSNFNASWSEAKTAQKSYGNNQAFMRLTGDEIGLARLKLSEYEQALRAAIALEGEGGKSTRKLADAYKKQEEELNALQKTTTKTTTRVKNLISSFVSAQAIVYLVQKSVYLLTDGIRAASEAAAEAEETANLFNTTFSNIATNANNVATSMASALGISKTAAQQALGTFGDLAMGYGQTQSAALEFAETAVKLGLDIISFKNIAGDTTEILQAMASGLAGNFENFRKWGIIVTMTEVNARLAAKGYDKLTGSALQFAKVQETLAIVQEKSANAQGDMEKTLNSTANVMRRVDEANKELLANIGSGINRVLTPLNLIWLDIAESINKAIRAQQLYDAGQKNIGVYDVRNNKEDREDFKADILNSYGAGSFFGNVSIIDEGAFINSMDEIIRIYEASAADVFSVLNELGIEYSKTVADAIIKIDELATSERAEEKSLEGRRSVLEDLTAEAENYFAALQAIQGVSITAGFGKYHHEGYIEGIISSSGSFGNAEKEIASTVRSGVIEGLESLKNANWESYISPIDLVFGKTDEIDGLTKKLDSVYAYYEEVNNYAITSGADFTDILASIASYYGVIQEHIEAISDAEERRQEALKTTSGMQSQLESVNKQNAQYGMTDRQKALDDIGRDFQNALANLNKGSKSYYDDLRELTLATRNLIEGTNALYDTIEQREAEAERGKEYENALDQLIALRDGARDELVNSGKSERVTALDEIKAVFLSILATLNPDSASYKEEYKTALDIYHETIKLTNKNYNEREKAEKAKARRTANEAASAVTDARSRQVSMTLPYQAELDSAMESFNSSFRDWAEAAYEAGYTQREVNKEYENSLKILKENMVADSYAAAGNIAVKGLGELTDLINSIYALANGGGAGDLLSILAQLAAQTELFQTASSILTDSILPVIDAFLKPLVPVIQQLGDLLESIIYPVLNAIFPIIEDIASWLTQLLGTLTPVMEIATVIMDLLRDTLIPIITLVTGTLTPFIEILNAIFQIVGAIIIPVLKFLYPIIQLFATVLVTVYAIISVVVNFISDSFKWLAGHVVGTIQDMLNGIIGIINGALGWLGVHINKVSWEASEWRNIDVFGNVQKNWDAAFDLLDGIDRNTLEIADNTAQDVDLSVYDELLSKGIISSNEYMAMVNKALGNGSWDPVDYITTSQGSYVDYRGTGQSVSVSYGDTTIIVQGEGLSAEDIANTIYRKLQERDRAGSAVFSTYA